MDRLSGDLEGRSDSGPVTDVSAIPLKSDAELLLDRSGRRLAVPEKLLNLAELDVLYDADGEALWTFMRPRGRPSFTPPMLADFERWQSLIAENFGPGRVPLKYLVLGSRAQGVFCFGGDLELFHQLIRQGDRGALDRKSVV